MHIPIPTKHKAGVKKINLGIDEQFVKCPACESHKMADVMVRGQYYHFLHITIFPFGKEVNIICQECGIKRYELPFDESLFSNYEDMKRRFRHPWYTYIFAGIALLITLTVIYHHLTS